jgi:hypothetical protein
MITTGDQNCHAMNYWKRRLCRRVAKILSKSPLNKLQTGSDPVGKQGLLSVFFGNSANISNMCHL